MSDLRTIKSEGQSEQYTEVSKIEDYIENLTVVVERLQVVHWLEAYDRRRKAGIA